MFLINSGQAQGPAPTKKKTETMNHANILLHKEFKSMFRDMCAVIGVQILYFFLMFQVISFFRFSGNTRDIGNTLMEWYTLGLFDHSYFVYPAMLAYYLYAGEKTSTMYVDLSLPARSDLYLRNKFLIITASMAISIVIVMVASFIYMPTEKPVGLYQVYIPNAHSVLDWVYRLVATPFLLLCLVCTAWGAAQVSQHHRFIAGLVALIASYVVYLLINATVLYDVIRFAYSAVTHILKAINSDSIDSTLYFKVYFSAKVIYVLSLGGLFYKTGMILFRKYSEI